MQLIGKSYYIAWFFTASPSSMETAESPDWKSRDRQAETSSTQVNANRRLRQKKKSGIDLLLRETATSFGGNLSWGLVVKNYNDDRLRFMMG